MAPTKSSYPRQIKEESDATTHNLSIGPDHEDEDGDNEIHSPSSYLNLNHTENEEAATNAKHEGDGNEEDERNVVQALVGALSTSQVRRGRGPNK
jgi:hypothetical protein